MDETRPQVQAIAIRDGLIIAAGVNADVREHAGSSTEVVSLKDRMLLPGFQDAHVHAAGGGLERLQCDLTALRTRDEYLAAIRAYATAHPERTWILGGGWSMDAFPGGVPSRDDLDRVVRGRPVFLPNRDHHGAWVNSIALQWAGIDRQRADPPGGRIERDHRSEPAGTLQEAAMDLVSVLIPAPQPSEIGSAILTAQEYLHALGITAWQEAIVGEYAGMPDCFEAYRTLDQHGQLTARVVGALWWDRTKGTEQIDTFLARRSQSTARFRAESVKIMLDGVCENFTASLLDPYDRLPAGVHTPRGVAYLEPPALQAAVTALDLAGFQVHMHAIGDRAVRDGLDAVESARHSNGSGANRHHLAHIQVVHPDDVPRFRTLGVTANAQPLWACADRQMTELTLPFLGPVRSTWQYPLGTLARAGARLAFGSDWPVSSPNPLYGIHVAVNRRPTREHSGTASDPFLPAERLTAAQAITAYTRGSAFLNHLDDRTGMIAAGKLADLTVVDRDLLRVPPDEIAAARVLLTVVDGRRVYTAAGW